MVEGLEDALQDVGPLLGLAQIEPRAAHDDRLAVVEKVLEQLAQCQDLRLVVDDRQQMIPKVVCIWVILYSWLRMISGISPRLMSSTTEYRRDPTRRVGR